jgi:hypothetical protein
MSGNMYQEGNDSWGTRRLRGAKHFKNESSCEVRNRAKQHEEGTPNRRQCTQLLFVCLEQVLCLRFQAEITFNKRSF